MLIPRHIFREYDIRGVAERDLSDDLARAIGAAFPLALRKAGDSGPAGGRLRVAVGRDGRLSSDRLFAALTAGLREAGADVISIGVGPSPLLYFAAHHLGTDGAVMITASHNPAPDNGFKMMRGKASFFGADIQRLADLIEDGAAHREPAAAPGGFEEVDLTAAYIDAVRASSRLDRTDVRFVVDAGNGAAGPLGLRALRALGFDPDPLFCEMDGRFPNHHPDPTVLENLEALRARVLDTGAALGIAWDGDGDRIGVIDDRGEVIWGDRLLVLFARTLLAERPGAAILGEVKCSEVLYADIAARGGRPILWKTGHSLIKTKMKEEGALLAGEMSGHMFFADRWPGFDDAVYAAVRLLEIVTREGRPVRELLADLPETFATPEIRVECPDAVKFEVVRRVTDHYRRSHRGVGGAAGLAPAEPPSAYKIIDIDGARVDFGDGAWGLCRASNTGPVLVLRFEARSPERRDAVRAEVEAVVAAALEGALADRGP